MTKSDLSYTLNWYEAFMYLLGGYTPKRFGHKVKEGIWYDSYHNKAQGTDWAFEKTTGTFLRRDTK